MLSTLLFHANRTTKDQAFYDIKDRILKKYGRVIGYDVQVLPGKKCHSCDGTGLFYRWWWEPEEEAHDVCNHCWGGWYKLPQYNILEKYSFGRFVFHRPILRYRRAFYAARFMANQPGHMRHQKSKSQRIDGYIDHHGSRHSRKSLFFLYLIYDKSQAWKLIKSHIRNYGRGYRYDWKYLPNWPRNIIYFLRNGIHSYPIQQLIRKFDQ